MCHCLVTKRRTARPLRRQGAIPRLRASGRAWYLRPNKKRITLYLDADIVEWFKSAGPGYQTRINRALWRAMKGEIDASLLVPQHLFFASRWRTIGERLCEQLANKILFGIQLCTYWPRRDNIRKGFGGFWRLERGLTPCAMPDGRVFDRETWMGPPFGFPLGFARGFGKTGQAFSKSARSGAPPVVSLLAIHSLWGCPRRRCGPPAPLSGPHFVCLVC
jgi:uncharacterized protein (DUF4415 family)